MKKLLLSICLASAVTVANAQDMMSKKGTPILPEAGDWSIGVDATPFIDWAFDKTRVMSNTGVTGSSGAIVPQKNMTLVGLYVKDAETAYRGMLRIGFGSTSNDALINQDGSTSTPPAQVTDNWSTSNMNITLGAGIQKWRGKGRLHGVYGAMASIMLGSSKNTFTYGNPFSTTYTAPGTTDWSQMNGPSNIGGAGRYTEMKNGSTFGIGLNGFIGAEYFFAPKMSFSAEYGWGLALSSTGEGQSTSEGWDGTTNAVRSLTTKTGGSSSFSLDVMNINSASTGNIVFHMYF